MLKKSLMFSVIVIVLALALFFNRAGNKASNDSAESLLDNLTSSDLPSMSIEALRQREYVGGLLIIEQTLATTAGYRQFIASYKSEGLKIYGLLTIPTTQKPQQGFPAIIFVHGYIAPQEYSTTKNYATYQAVLARNNFVTFKPDLRGHGQSEGQATSAHFSENYVVDVLNAIEYLKNHEDINPSRIGYWGHSNGGEIGLRVVTISPDIKAAVFWAGVVGSYKDMFETYTDKIPFFKDRENPLTAEYGQPSENPDFWMKIDPYYYLAEIDIPIQLHHGTADASVPIELSLSLKQELEKLHKPVEYFEYPGDNHNISRNLTTAWQRTVKFFNENL